MPDFTHDPAAMRVDYSEVEVSTAHAIDDALLVGWEALLRNWLDDAVDAGVVEPNAMVVATVDARGHPDARTVLCKALRSDGVVFYTNYSSDKGHQLAAAPYAAVTFVWPVIARQVRLRGPVSRVSCAETAAYWRSRPRGSRLGAWASHQSAPVDSRADLERAMIDTEARFDGVDDIPVPPVWGGYLVTPEQVEFWQGRSSRLHDRIRLTLGDAGQWHATRLAP